MDVPGTAWQWGEAAIPLTERNKYVRHLTSICTMFSLSFNTTNINMVRFLFPHLCYCIHPAEDAPVLTAPVAPEALCVSGCVLAGHLFVG